MTWQRTVTSCVLLLSLGGAARAQTLDEVRKALADYFGPDVTSTPAHAQFETWGADALPFLRTLAGKPSVLGLGDGPDDAWALVCATRDIDTPEAFELLVDILDDTTGVAPHQALTAFPTIRNGSLALLRDDTRFKQIIFRFTLSRGPLSSLERGLAAGVIASMGWEEGEDVIEAMLDDPDRTLVKRAAAALQQLTGRTVVVKPLPLEFPAMGDEAPPLGALRTLPKSKTRMQRFAFWPDGHPGLLQTADKSLLRMGLKTEDQAARWELPVQPTDVLSLATASHGDQWIVTVADDAWGHRSSAVVSLDAAGHETWRWTPKRADDIGMTALPGTDGTDGVVLGIGGDDGVVALDLDGQLLWSLWNPVVYSVDSHPDLADRVLICGGGMTIVDSAGKPLASTRGPPTGALGHLYAHDAVLFPDEDGGAAVIAVGVGVDSIPTLVRLDAALHLVWRAKLPAQASGLVILERGQPIGSPSRTPPLFAAVTEDGQLLVFDENGGLRAPLRVADEPDAGDTVSVYGIDAGVLQDGSRALVIQLLRETQFYPYR